MILPSFKHIYPLAAGLATVYNRNFFDSQTVYGRKRAEDPW